MHGLPTAVSVLLERHPPPDPRARAWGRVALRRGVPGWLVACVAEAADLHDGYCIHADASGRVLLECAAPLPGGRMPAHGVRLMGVGRLDPDGAVNLALHPLWLCPRGDWQLGSAGAMVVARCRGFSGPPTRLVGPAAVGEGHVVVRIDTPVLSRRPGAAADPGRFRSAVAARFRTHRPDGTAWALLGTFDAHGFLCGAFANGSPTGHPLTEGAPGPCLPLPPLPPVWTAPS